MPDIEHIINSTHEDNMRYVQSHIQKNLKANIMMVGDKKFLSSVASAAEHIITALGKGNSLYICGNGGSATDSLHFSGEFVGRYKLERIGLRAHALVGDIASVTSIGNDYGFKNIFARQLEAYGKKGDIIVGISTSGNSENVIEAFKYAKDNGIYAIGMLGKDGGKLRSIGDHNIIIPKTPETDTVQQCHITIIHAICGIVEKAFEGYKSKLDYDKR